MAHIFIPDGIRVVLQGNGDYFQELINTVGVQVPGGGPPSYADCLAVAIAVRQWWENTYHNMVGTGVALAQVVATSMASAPGPQAQQTSPVLGVRAGTQTANQNSLCVKLATNSTGRRHRGRFYSWPAVTTDFVSPDIFTTGYVAAMLLALADLGARLATAGYVWAIASPTDAKMYPIVRAVAVDSIVDSQNRRTTQHGR
jgi:hypothetical protein